MMADTTLHLHTPTTLRLQLLTIFRHSYVVQYTDKPQTYSNLTMKFIITVFQFMYEYVLRQKHQQPPKQMWQHCAGMILQMGTHCSVLYRLLTSRKSSVVLPTRQHCVAETAVTFSLHC